jgi:hypothetical protein
MDKKTKTIKETKETPKVSKEQKETPKVSKEQKETPKVSKEQKETPKVSKEQKETPKVSREVPKEVKEILNESDENNSDVKKIQELMEKYDNLITFIDYKNMLYYGALFRELFEDLKTENDDGKIDKSIKELANILEKACNKLNFDIQNASMKQLVKLYMILIEKLGGSNKLRAYDSDIMEPLMARMYSDNEILEILYELEEKRINPENIIGINAANQIVFSNKKTYSLEPSAKNFELIDFLALYNKTLSLTTK